jgi:hypothetical protein
MFKRNLMRQIFMQSNSNLAGLFGLQNPAVVLGSFTLMLLKYSTLDKLSSKIFPVFLF